MSAAGRGGAWPELLASALVGTARNGERAEAVLDAAAVQALRRRAGLPTVPARMPQGPSPVEDGPMVGPAAAARVDDLLAVDSATRNAGPVRDAAGRLQLLAEWLEAAAAAGRRLPPELAPALLDAGRRHPELRPLVGPVAGRLAGWLATQRADWAYAAGGDPAESTVDDGGGGDAWEYGATAQRVGHLLRLRERDPGAGRALLEAGWATEPPEDRAALLAALETGLSTADESIVESALDDRHKQVRDVALELLAMLPDSGYARRMVARARECVDLSGPGRIGVTPPQECDRSMRRDGITPRPPAGTGERAWWLEEVLARTPLSAWPPPAEFFGRGVSEEWLGPVRRGLARAAAARQDGGWAAALVDPATAVLAASGHPADRQLLAALLRALPADDLAARAAAGLRHGLGSPAAVGVEQILALCPRPWPNAVAEAVLAALDERLGRTSDRPGRGADQPAATRPPQGGSTRPPQGGSTRPPQGGRAEFSSSWRIVGICELAALRLPAGLAGRAVGLVQQWRAVRPDDPAVAVLERLAATLRYRDNMLEELS